MNNYIVEIVYVERVDAQSIEDAERIVRNKYSSGSFFVPMEVRAVAYQESFLEDNNE